MKLVLLVLSQILAANAFAETVNRHPYTGRYVMSYQDGKDMQVDVLTIDPDGYFTIRDYGGGKVKGTTNPIELHFSQRGMCSYNFHRLEGGKKIKMELVKGIPSVCPPSGELVMTDFQPHAPPSLGERFKKWWFPPQESETSK